LKQIQFKNTSILILNRKGTAIVLLHGFLENQSMYNHTLQLCKRTVITIDLLGHGETECLGYVHTMEDNADAVHSVLLELGIRKSILVGHSMGLLRSWLSPCTLNM
jgi:pimeloyl-ACP methyl ester carboxylesterase